jgi:hypothetical protein
MTVGDEGYKVDGMAWQELKTNSLVLPSDSWAKLKIYILEMCKLNNNCSQELVQKKIDLLTKEIK